MKALTLWQPWAWAIAHAGKDVENRTWAPPAYMIGERIAIHAGKRFDEEAWTFLSDPCCSPIDESLAAEDGLFDVPCADEIARGAVVAVATLAEVLRFGEGEARGWPWYGGPVGWVLTDVVAMEPVPCRGAQGLWDLPVDIERSLKAAA